MSEFDDQIRDAYAAFWAKRNEVKLRQRQELEDETAEARRALAKVMWSARRSPDRLTVADIANLLGVSNKNFLYSVLNDKPLYDPDAVVKPVGRPSTADKVKVVETEKSKPFHLTASYNDMGDMVVKNHATGYIMGYRIEKDDDGHIVEIPEDWFVDTLTPDEVQFYKDLIVKIESGE